MESILLAVIAIGVLAVISAIILYFVAQKFKVYEDPRIDLVNEVLPAANCGGCGYAGCRNFAESCIKADSLDKLNCPVGGNEVIKKVAAILGKNAAESSPKVAVVRCSGSLANRKKVNTYDGAANCAVVSALYAGETDCHYGCHGLGDCVTVCKFDAIYINPETKLPVVIDDKCTACGMCVTACPKGIIELRKKNPKDRKIFVSCINHDKGGIAKKSCAVACTACTKCQKVCPHDAITIENFLAYIDPDKCKLCRKCVEVCDTHAILEINFPERKVKEDKELPEKKEVITKNDLQVTEKEKVELKKETEENKSENKENKE